MKHTWLILILLITAQLSKGQPFTLDDRIQPVELIMNDYKKDDTIRRGRINITNVTQRKDTSYYFVTGLSIFSPIYFGITTPEGSPSVKVFLCKENWKQPHKKGETGSKGHWEAQFKTEGDFGIMVVAKGKPATYTLLTWAGDESREVGLRSAFQGGGIEGENGTKSGEGKSEGGSNVLLYVIIGLLVVIIGLLAWKIIGRKKS